MYKLDEIAKMFNVTKATVRNWIRYGKIDAIEIPYGNKTTYRVTEEGLDRFKLKTGFKELFNKGV